MGIDGGGFAAGDGEQVGAVVPHGPVPGCGLGQRVAVHLGALQPGQVLADPGGVGPDRVGVERAAGPGQLSYVGIEHLGRLRGQDRGLRASTTGRH